MKIRTAMRKYLNDEWDEEEREKIKNKNVETLAELMGKAGIIERIDEKELESILEDPDSLRAKQLFKACENGLENHRSTKILNNITYQGKWHHLSQKLNNSELYKGYLEINQDQSKISFRPEEVEIKKSNGYSLPELEMFNKYDSEIEFRVLVPKRIRTSLKGITPEEAMNKAEKEAKEKVSNALKYTECKVNFNGGNLTAYTGPSYTGYKVERGGASITATKYTNELEEMLDLLEID